MHLASGSVKSGCVKSDLKEKGDSSYQNKPGLLLLGWEMSWENQ